MPSAQELLSFCLGMVSDVKVATISTDDRSVGSIYNRFGLAEFCKFLVTLWIDYRERTNVRCHFSYDLASLLAAGSPFGY